MAIDDETLVFHPDAFARVSAWLDKPFRVGDTVRVVIGGERYDVLHGYGYPMQPRDQFFALLNMPGAE